MDGAYPVDMGFVDDFWLKGLCLLGQFALRLNQVDDSQETVGVQYLFHVGAYLVGKDGEDAYHLAALLCLQLTHAVVGLHHLGRLYVDGLSCGTLVVHNTVDLTFQAWGYGNHQTAVAQGRGGILVH